MNCWKWVRLSALVVWLAMVMYQSAGAQAGPGDEAEVLNTEVVELYREGKYVRAIPLAQRALAIQEKVLGADHPRTATALDNLALLYSETGAYIQAEPLYQRALQIRENTFGPDHPRTATSLINLAELYSGTGAYAQAELLHQRALAIYEKALGPDHPDTAIPVNNLAQLYRGIGAYAKAEPLYQRALAIHEKALGPEHPNTAVSLNNLANLYSDTGSYIQAERLYRRALVIREKELGPGHPHTAISLSSLAAVYSDTGDYTQAEALYKRALAIREKALGPDHSVTADSVSSLAGLYFKTGAYTRAESLYQRALRIREKVLGSDDPSTAASLNSLALLYLDTGGYAQAEPLLLRALGIREKALGPDHPDTASSLNNLAGLYNETGVYAKAEPLYRRALEIREEVLGPDHPNTATSLNNLASLYVDTGAYAQAELLYQRALAIAEKVLGPSQPSTAKSLGNLAGLYSDTGAYAQAEPLYQRALAIHEKALGPDHPDTATSPNNLAGLFRDRGDYVQAELLYQRALAISEKARGPSHPATAVSLNNLALLYLDTGAHAQAEPLYRRALEILQKALGPDHPDTASSLNNLAGLYDEAGAYAQAEPLYRRALEIREEVLGPDHPDTATSLNNLASLYRDTSAYAQAEQLYRRALAIAEKEFGPDHRNTATFLNNLASLYGAYMQAERLYRRALEIREKVLGPEHPDTGRSLNQLAAVYYSTDVYAQADPLFQRAQSITEVNLTNFLLAGSETRQQAYLRQVRGDLDAYVSISLAAPNMPGIMLGLTGVLQYKGRVLDARSNSVAQLRRSIAPKDRELFDRMTSIAREFSTLTFRGPESITARAYRDRLDTLRVEQNSLQSQLSARSAALGRALAPITLVDVQAALPEDAVLVEWFRYQPVDLRAERVQRFGAPRYAAYVLKRTGDPAVVDIGEAKPIENLITRFRSVLMDPTSDTRGQFEAPDRKATRVNPKQLTAGLSEKLVKPLQPYLEGKARWLLSPDGALNLVPFVALFDERGEYLARRFEISYLTSGRDLLRIGNDSLPRSGDVVLANPNYGSGFRVEKTPAAFRKTRSPDLDRRGLVWGSLEGTRTEAERLQTLLQLDAKQVLTGDRATEAQLRALQGPRILHLATHGFFLKDEQLAAVQSPTLSFGSDRAMAPLGENPLLRSGLALAGANARRSGDDDGILTAAEVAELDMVGTQLVVLSACETALGSVNAGDGVYGLRRALVLAGAQSQLVSLWKVDDAATQELMVDYYRRLLKGEGRAAALRSAQKAMLTDPARRHPYYWAAFIPIGNWSPLASDFTLEPQRP